MVAAVMGNIVLKILYLNGRWYVMRIEGDGKRLVYFGKLSECLKFVDNIYAIYVESDLEITI